MNYFRLAFTRKLAAVGLLAAWLLAGCAGIAPGSLPSPDLTETSEPDVPTLVRTSTPEGFNGAPLNGELTQTVTPATQAPAVVRVKLRLWIPPQFDPHAETDAGVLLAARLEEFTRQRPDVEIQIRIKALSGPGGLLDSLTTARSAAPLAMPDLVFLSREMMESAAIKGLVFSLDDLVEVLDDRDWYDYARQLARIQSSTFGLPFAGDALVLVYRANLIEPPLDWTGALELRSPIIFPAADPLALFTTAQYQSKGGVLRDDQGRPYLDADQLASVLDFYILAEESGAMPYWLTQYQNDDQAWSAFVEKRANMVVTWASRFLNADKEDLAIMPLPTSDGEPFTLATGWVWALSSADRDRRLLSMELAEFLCQAQFMAEWTQASGYLPARANALDVWREDRIRSVIAQVLLSAELSPSTDIATLLGAPLQQAVLEVLKKQNDASGAAQVAADALSNP
jgi:ABC-type glycerol-3-phosphate transport system substrate-binding protein